MRRGGYRGYNKMPYYNKFSFATCGVTCSTWINLETEGDSNTKGLARLTVNNSCKCLIIFVEHE